MLGFLYLILILGWILIVIFLKCKKSLAPHLAFPYNSNYSQSVSERQCSPSVHVIQLQEDELIDPAYIAQHNHLHHSHYHSHHRLSRPMLLNSGDLTSDGPPSIGALSTYLPTDAVINPAYTNDENYIINGPPPSYEEVMSKPDVYPKVHDTTTPPAATTTTTTTVAATGSVKSNNYHQENV
ncbi:hypothetical protein ACFFRR_007619 [Megaselia abdita]